MTDAAAAALSPMPPPAIRIEKECLHDAEEAGKLVNFYEISGILKHLSDSFEYLRRESITIC